MSNLRMVVLIIGDTITLGLVTLYGFASHDELETAGLRLLTTFLPLVFAWILISPHLGLFDSQRLEEPRQLWRSFWAMVLAAPLAAWMRGAWLKTPIQPIFVVIIGGISALAILAWRSLFWLMFYRARNKHG
ncbi:MAG: DUF3054 domain-containing protein [Anaerolineales bacterium]|nr:MAG: DUF3054 domain-containing protein [Anaerolineales bacterium]